MPYYDAPNTDAARLAFLQTAAQTGTQDLAEGNAYLSQATVDALTALAAQYATAMQDVSDKLGVRMQEVEETQEAVTTLQTYVRDLWELIRRRVRRLDLPVGVLAYYGLPADGNTPKPGNRAEWLDVAEQVVQGDAAAVAAGYDPASEPTAAQVQAQLDAARQEAADIAPADRAYDQAQAALADLRTQADALIEQVVAELRFALYDLTPPSQRRIMRTYGATFRYYPGEEPDPDDPPA